jgi:TatD DNase family protein
MFINIHAHHPSLKGIEIQSLNIDENPSAQLFSCGYHPWFIADKKCDIKKLQQLATQANCLAIGEIGIDKLRGPSLAIQMHYLEQQLALAAEISKPVIIHNVKSTSEILAALTKFKNLKVIFHGFNRKISIAEQMLKAGYQLSFGRHILIDNSNAQAALKICYPHQFFLETDDTKLAISDVYSCAAHLRDISLEMLQQQISHNFNTTFATSF